MADATRERDANVINLVASRLNSPLPKEAPAAVLFDLIDPCRLDGLVVFAEMLYHFTNAVAMAQFLERYRPLPMTSVGCGDYESLAFVDALQARGYRVPHDVAVTGFNNLEVTRFATPGLTTVDRHIAELSRRATTMLLDLLAGHAVPEQVILAPELVVRRSCGCLPQAVVSAATARLPAAPQPAPPDSAVAAVARAGDNVVRIGEGGREVEQEAVAGEDAVDVVCASSPRGRLCAPRRAGCTSGRPGRSCGNQRCAPSARH